MPHGSAPPVANAHVANAHVANAHVPSWRSGLAAACLFGALLAWLALAPRHLPAPPGGDAAASASGFSAARAQVHVQALAAAPRPIASHANLQARDYLLAQLRALGLAPEVQTETVRTASSDLTGNVRVTLAEVHNVVVKKPGMASGHASRPAVLAVAHYDSGTATLGAADGAASSAALLETLRVLQAGPPLDNDLLFVFTDGDASQALGTRGFVQSHPWARRARVALRFDNPGNRGPLELIGAEHADGFSLSAWARLAPHPMGSSFMGELYARRPQHEAAALLAGPGPAVLHFATTAGPLGGGAWDIPERLDPASLQHEGDTMLALLRHFGSADLPASRAGEMQRGQVFFSLPGVGILHYSYLMVWPLAVLACLLCVAACRTGMRRQRIVDSVDGIDIVHGAFGFLMMAALATFATWLCREAFPSLAPRFDTGLLADGPGPDAGVRWQLFAFTLLPAAVFIGLQRGLQERIGAGAMALGAMCTLTIGLLLTSWGAPGASYVLAWPLLAAQAAWLALSSRRAHGWTAARRRAVLLLAAAPAALLTLPAARDSLLFLSPAWLVLPSVLACCLPALCGPLLAEIGQRLVVRPLLLGGCAGLLLAGTLATKPSALPQLPAPNQLVYFKDTPSWQAFWLYPPVPLDAWTRRFFPNTMHPYQLPYLLGDGSPPVWYAAARRDDSISYPYLIIEKDQRKKDQNGSAVRHVEFLLRSKNRAPEIVLRMVGAESLRTSVNGRVLTNRRYRGWKLDLHGMEDRDLRFAFDLIGDPSFMIFIQERIPGIPERGLPVRPAGMRPRLLPQTGTTISSDVLLFR
jgi:hypothetical protein